MRTSSRFSLSAVGLLLVAATAVVTAPAAHAQNLVTNPGFETGDTSGWTFTPAPVNGFFFIQSSTANSHSGGYHARFAAVDPAGDTLSQNLATTAGANYTFSFWFRNDDIGDDRFTAFWDGTSVLNLAPTTTVTTDPAENNYIQYSFNVTASTSSTEIRFNAYDVPRSFRLDDVSVTANDPTPPTAVTPEASSLVNLTGALLGPGILGIVAVRRRRKVNLAA